MSFSFPDDVTWEEAKIYNNLPEEEKEIIKEKAIERIKVKNPSAMNLNVAFMRKFLLQWEIRELINEGYIGRCSRGPG
jgi:hypothetical protein